VPGPAACLIFAPILREFVQNNITLEQVVERFNGAMKATLDALIAVMVRSSAQAAGADPMVLNRTLMMHLATSLGYTLTDETCAAMMAWFAANPRGSVDFPLEAWGLVPPVDVPFVFGDQVFVGASGQRIDNKSVLVVRDRPPVSLPSAAEGASMAAQPQPPRVVVPELVSVELQRALDALTLMHAEGRMPTEALAVATECLRQRHAAAASVVASQSALATSGAVPVVVSKPAPPPPVVASEPQFALSIEPTEVSDKWSGFTLGSNGTYRLIPTNLAPAQAVGMSKGQELVSNLRFTFARDGEPAQVLPKTNWGVSSAGMEHLGKGLYRPYLGGRSLDLDQPLDVEITGLGTADCALKVTAVPVVFGVERAKLFAHKMLPWAETIVVAYKFLRFDVTFTAPPMRRGSAQPPAAAAAAAAATPVPAATAGEASPIAPEDLTPAALIARLHRVTQTQAQAKAKCQSEGGK